MTGAVRADMVGSSYSLDRMTAILFVCLGNICRSPLAEGVFRARAETADVAARFDLDSAGCGKWHVGEAPDPRSISAAAHHGIDISGQRARLISPADFDMFDLILGMDRDNVAFLKRMQPSGSRARVALYRDEALGENKDVPDPYYGEARDFEHVYQLCARASDALLTKLV